MTTTAVPSQLPEDFQLNVENLDKFSNSTSATFTDRFGNPKKTRAGLSAELLNAGIYGTTAEGLTATTSGQYFSAISADGAEYLILYLHSAGVAVEQKRYPATAYITNATQLHTSEAVGRAAVADGATFRVQGSGDVAAYEYRRISGTVSVLIAAYPSIELNSRIARTAYRGWVIVLRAAGGKLGLGINRAGRVVLGVGGDIVARITTSEATIAATAASLTTQKSAFKLGMRGAAILRVLDGTRTKVALEVTRAGRLISMGRDVLAEIDLTASLRSLFRVKAGSRGALFSVRDENGKAPLIITGSGRTRLMGRDVLAEVDVVAAQMTAMLTNPALLSKYVSPSIDLTLLGDSQINGAGPTPWRSLIVPLISARNYRNLAVGGQTSTQIAARFGAVYALLTVAGGVIPASGSVAVTFCRVMKTDGTFDNTFTPLTSQSAQSLSGTLLGVPGTLVRATDGTYTFARTAVGGTVNCYENAPFKSSYADYDLNLMVVGLGRNNITDLPTIKRDVEYTVAAQRTIEKRIIILTVTNGGSTAPGVATNEAVGTTIGNNVVALEDWAESRFTGPGFVVVNVRKLLMPLNDGTADDLADVAAGTVPRSLRIDAVHYSAAAHAYLATHIASIINAKGW